MEQSSKYHINMRSGAANELRTRWKIQLLTLYRNIRLAQTG